jgi:hypothetical protein
MALFARFIKNSSKSTVKEQIGFNWNVGQWEKDHAEPTGVTVKVGIRIFS